MDPTGRSRLRDAADWLRAAWRRRPVLWRRIIVAGVVFLVVSVAGLEFSTMPRFCLTCHYMRPYYEDWENSSHNTVSCVECHFPPGVGPAIARKFQTINQVTKYVTRQYGTRPWTEIDDASCLRSGCHETRLLRGVVDFNGVRFDHTPHLSGFRRVTQLRCTACHSQIVIGTHMTVTDTSCYLCHFKFDRPAEAERVSDCRLCHKQIPAPEAGSDEGYDHTRVMDRGVACQECHSDVTRGDGFVPENSCVICHAERARLALYKQATNPADRGHDEAVKSLHRNHVTDHKIECTQCHQEITHKIAPLRQQATLGLDCASCHPVQHDAARKLYYGVKVAGVSGEPDPMAQARVACRSCHRTHVATKEGGVAAKAGAAACMNCHGETYGRTLAVWAANADAQVGVVQKALGQARRGLSGSRADESKRAEAGKMLAAAGTQLRTVRVGGAVHNVAYAEKLLETARGRVNEAMALIGSRYRAPPLPKIEVAKGSAACLDCHTRAPEKSLRVFGTDFSHGQHQRARLDLDCVTCHRGNGPQDAGHGALTRGRDGCRTCHERSRLREPHPNGWETTHGRARRQLGSCSVCHGADFCSRTDCHGPVVMPHPPTYTRKHGGMAMGSPQVCGKCHKPGECVDCHGVEMPHPDNWPKQKHLPVARTNISICAKCHTTKECTDCHGLPMPHPRTWTQKHGAESQRQARVCGKCHDEKDCQLCHREGRLAPTNHQAADWRQKHAAFGAWNARLCQLCHGADPCVTCHKRNPHADGFLTGHITAAGQRPGSCLVCHQRDYCEVCHSTPPSSHTAEFVDDHTQAGSQSPQLCALCHGEDACNTCHGLPMPHPANYLLEGHMAARPDMLKAGSVCYRCHEQDYCAVCHPAE